MATIHVRDVSESAVTTLKVRAARAGQSLQSYVRQLLESEAAATPPEEAAERARDIAAPHAIDLECAAALRGLVRGKKLPPAEAGRALELLGRMRLERYGHVPLLARIWQLRHNVWPYDAAYVALAEWLDAEL